MTFTPFFKNNTPGLIQTRFGILEYSAETTYWFKEGILGFSDCNFFTLAHFPLPGIPDKFMILQNIEKLEVGFMLMNTVITDDEPEANLIAYEDLLPALNKHKVTLDQVSMHFIASIDRKNGTPVVSLNLRAPIVLNPTTMQGWQMVLDNSKYSMQYLFDD